MTSFNTVESFIKPKDESFTYKEYIPENCESVTDYTQPPKDRVKFHYPKNRTYWEAVKHSGFITFTLFYWYFMVIPFLWIIIAGLSTYLAWFMITTPGAITTFLNGLVTPVTTVTVTTINTDSPLQSLAQFFVFVAFVVGIPSIALLIASLDKERLSNMIPHMNYRITKHMGNMKRKMIEAKDVFDNKYIIPIFSNVYLDWKGTEDFAIYIQKVEVLALPADYEYMDRKGKKKKPEINESDFRAVFYFTQMPKSGNMEIIFD